MNIVAYIHRCYIARLVHRLTEKYNVTSSVLKLCSSIITNEHVVISCSDPLRASGSVGLKRLGTKGRSSRNPHAPDNTHSCMESIPSLHDIARLGVHA
jgi:hypothetical protein